MTLSAPAMLWSLEAPPPVIPLDQDALERLPAEARTRVAAAQKVVEAALDRLCAEPLTDGLVAEVAQETRAPLHTVGRAFWTMVATSPEEGSRERLTSSLRDEEERISQALGDDKDSRDTARRVLGLLRSFYETAFAPLRQAPPEMQLEFRDHLKATLDAAETLPGDLEAFEPFERGFVSFMAAAVAATRGNAARAKDLIDVAFLEFTRLRRALRKYGVELRSFPEETAEQRRRRLLDDAERVRRSLTDDDWRVLDEARMHNLR